MDTLHKQNKLYRTTLICTAVFAVLSVVMMIGFKTNEAFFDTHGHISILAENELEAAMQESSAATYIKRNVAVSFESKAQRKLIVPLKNKIEAQQVSVREEFTKNKLVLTIKDGKDCISENTVVTSDSDIMQAVGIYSQKNDLVVEVYGKDIYAYQLLCADSEIMIEFTPVHEVYEKTAVVYIPYNDRTRLLLTEWQNEVAKYAEENALKVYLCSTMQEEYSQKETADFANRLHADLLIGIEVVNTLQGEGFLTVCNSDYFIPQFGNSEAAKLVKEAFLAETDINFAGYRNSTEDDIMLEKSKVPSAMVIFGVDYAKGNALEFDYNLNHGMMAAIKVILQQIIN